SIELLAGYEKKAFSIDDAKNGTNKPDVPNLNYSMAHAQLGLGYAATKDFSLGLKLGYLHVLDAGEIASAQYFPRLSVMGATASLFVAYHIASGFGVRLQGDVERFGYTMNPEVGDEKVAGGAVDQYI